MKHVLLFALGFVIAGCVEDASSTMPSTGVDGPSMTPQLIIETGYLKCEAGDDQCADGVTCSTADGESACLEPDDTQCIGQLNCACEGTWVCGDRVCLDVEGGFECQEANPMPRCVPEACGPLEPEIKYCGDGSIQRQLCERRDDGECGWRDESCDGRECADGDEECAQASDSGGEAAEQAGGMAGPVGGQDESGGDAGPVERENDGGAPGLGGEANDNRGPVDIEVEAGGMPADGTPVDGEADANGDGPDHVLSAEPCPPTIFPNQPYRILSAAIVGQTIEVELEMTQVCERSSATACPGEVVETAPTRIAVQLSHAPFTEEGEACVNVLEQETIHINLAWIDRLFTDAFAGAVDEITVVLTDGAEQNFELLYRLGAEQPRDMDEDENDEQEQMGRNARWADLETTQERVATVCEPVEMANDRYSILDATIEGDTLSVVAEYGLGCVANLFTPCAGNLVEGNPAQIGIQLFNDVQIPEDDDQFMCLPVAGLERIDIDLSWIRNDFTRTVMMDSGEILIELQGPLETLELRYAF